MKRLLIILTALILTSVFACDNKIKCDCSSKSVCVTFGNYSGQPVQSIILGHGNGYTKLVTTGQLANYGLTCLSYENDGEDAFRLTAILSNGDTIKSREEYSEGGYKFEAGISKDKKINIIHKDTY